MPRAMAPRLDGATSYGRDFGEAGADPMAHAPATEADTTRCCTTKDLSAGTQRNTWHLPGYTGFQAVTSHNGLAGEHSNGRLPRRDTKVDEMLFNLQQFPRSRLPGYTGFKPVEASNITVAQPAHGPTTDTVYGLTNDLRMRAGNPIVDKRYFNSNDGIMGFYTQSGLFISENGRTEAQKYYVDVRPLEGRAKHSQPSRRARNGAPFPKNSVV